MPRGNSWNPASRPPKEEPARTARTGISCGAGDISGRDAWLNGRASAAARGCLDTWLGNRLGSGSGGGGGGGGGRGGALRRPSEGYGELSDVAGPRPATGETRPARFIGVFDMTADDALDLSCGECHGDSVPCDRSTFNQANAGFSINDRHVDGVDISLSTRKSPGDRPRGRPAEARRGPARPDHSVLRFGRP